MGTLKLVTSASGDWTIAYLDGERFTEGHDGWSELLSDLCSHLKIDIIQQKISDEKMEERCYGED